MTELVAGNSTLLSLFLAVPLSMAACLAPPHETLNPKTLVQGVVTRCAIPWGILLPTLNPKPEALHLNPFGSSVSVCSFAFLLPKVAGAVCPRHGHGA